MYCLFRIKSKLFFKHMPETMYVNVSECYQVWYIYLRPNYMCVLIYMGIYAHVYT